MHKIDNNWETSREISGKISDNAIEEESIVSWWNFGISDDWMCPRLISCHKIDYLNKEQNKQHISKWNAQPATPTKQLHIIYKND